MILIWWVIVGFAAGWVTGKLMHGSGHRARWDMLTGVAGAVAGGVIMKVFGLSSEGRIPLKVLVAVCGGAILTAIVHLIIGLCKTKLPSNQDSHIHPAA